MTVSKEYNKHIYEGNGLTRDWPYNFDLPITAAGAPDTSLIHVFRTNLRGEVTEVTPFSVDAETGTLTYPTSGSPLESGEKLTILRLLDVRQQFFDPSNQANLYPETLEDNTDRLVMMIQQIDEEVGRAVTMGEGYEGEEVTAEGLLEARDIAISAAETAEGYAAQLPAIADELGVNLVADEADLRAKITVIGPSDATLVIATSIPLAEDLTIPSNIALAFKNTGSLEPAVTKTLTINGPVDAGLWQIFGGEGTTTGAIQSHYIYPEWFGAVGDGITDDTLAIQAAVAIPAVVWCSAKYRITDTIALVSTGCTGMVWEGTCANSHFLYDGNGVAMSIQGFNRVSGFTFRVVKQTREWDSNEATADRTSTGILFVGGGGTDYLDTHATVHSTFFIESVMNFALGVRFAGVATWNRITLGYLLQNWVALYWDEHADLVWSNENYFYGGEIKCFRPSTWPTLITGNRMMHINGSGNCFFGLCLENNQSMEYIVTGDGSSNNFFGTRLENILPGSIDLRNTAYVSFPNLWVGGYELSKNKFTDGALYSNSVIGGGSWIFGGSSPNGIYMTNALSSMVSKSIFKTGNISCGAENTFVPGKGLTMDIHPAKIEMYKGLDGYENPSLVLEGGPNYFGRILFGTGQSGHIAGETPGIQADNFSVLKISGSAMVPYTDDYMNIGSGSNRFDDIYATNGSILTSDEREKQDIRDLSEAEKAVAARIKGLMKVFRFKSAVEKKGDDARIHFGVMAQQVAQAFRDEGLAPERYALFCYDEWDETPEITDEEGNVISQHSPAGNRYGIRYSELLAFVIGAM